VQSGEATNSTYMMPSPLIEPGPHWWEASALITSPSLHRKKGNYVKTRLGTSHQ